MINQSTGTFLLVTLEALNLYFSESVSGNEVFHFVLGKFKCVSVPHTRSGNIYTLLFASCPIVTFACFRRTWKAANFSRWLAQALNSVNHCGSKASVTKYVFSSPQSICCWPTLVLQSASQELETSCNKTMKCFGNVRQHGIAHEHGIYAAVALLLAQHATSGINCWTEFSQEKLSRLFVKKSS